MDPSQFRVNQGIKKDELSELPPPPTPHYPKQQKNKSRKYWLLLGFILLIGVGAVVWVELIHSAKPVKKSTPSAPHTIQSTPQSSNQPVIPATTYTSAAFSTTFSYPSSWTVVDSGNAPLEASSPALNLTSANGQNVEGQIVLTIAKQGQLPSGFTNQSIAVLTSTKVAYSNPTTVQAAETYLSFIQYPATVYKGGLDGIYLTGNYGYIKDQSIPSSDLAQVSPLVYFSFYQCGTSACSPPSRTPLAIASSQWSQPTLSAPVLLIIKSFSFD